jgi:purine-binding chemotaxis protein CheW
MPPTLDALTFALGSQRCALALEAVVEVFRPVWVTAVPDSDGYLLGFINVRGVAVPMFDLRARFGYDASGYTRDARFVLVRIASQPVGLVVDGVFDVIDAGEHGFLERQTFSASRLPAVVSGLFEHQGHIVPLLDLSKVVSAYDLTRISPEVVAEVADRMRWATPAVPEERRSPIGGES